MLFYIIHITNGTTTCLIPSHGLTADRDWMYGSGRTPLPLLTPHTSPSWHLPLYHATSRRVSRRHSHTKYMTNFLKPKLFNLSYNRIHFRNPDWILVILICNNPILWKLYIMGVVHILKKYSEQKKCSKQSYKLHMPDHT